MAYRGSGGLTPYPGGTPSQGLRHELDRFFEEFAGRRGSSWMPAVDVRENQREISLDLELPGIKPEDVEVNVENGVLTVSGEKRADRKEGEEGRYHLVERSYGSFMRSFTLPQGVDEQQISADFDDGVLHVRIPKEALPQPRRIQVGRGQDQGNVSGRSSHDAERNIGTTRESPRAGSGSGGASRQAASGGANAPNASGGATNTGSSGAGGTTNTGGTRPTTGESGASSTSGARGKSSSSRSGMAASSGESQRDEDRKQR
jgi:HSP20 family protein